MKVAFTTTVGEVSQACGGAILHGAPEVIIHTITTDSRDLGRDNLFVPIVGEKFDGHRFIRPLAEDGALAGFMTMHREHKSIAQDRDCCAILCGDTLQAFGKIAASHRDRVSPVVVGITGTNGKTTTKEIAAAIIQREKECLKNEKNYNNEIGLPFTILGLTDEHEIAVVEMGMNHPGELERLSMIAKPDIGLITNIGEGHLEFIGTVEDVALVKSEVMFGMKPGSLIFLNRDTRCLDILIDRAADRGLRVKTFGLDNNADIYPESYELFMDSLTVRLDGESYSVPLYGIHNVYNSIAAIAIALELGISTESIRNALADFTNVEMRSQIIEGETVVINDTYNANPSSTRYALKSLPMIFPKRRKIAVLSDMKELGDAAGYYHRETGKEVYENGFACLFCWGLMTVDIILGAIEAGMDRACALHFEDKDELIAALKDELRKDDVVLVKGSRSMKMEEVVNAIVH